MSDPELAAAVDAAVDNLVARRRIPRATYRLQLNAACTFEHARNLVTYLDELGASDCYVSPIFTARSHSTHGYDICNHSEINPALGGEQAFDGFAAALRERGMGLILDMVPNHMGVGDDCNTWWMDVLENGPGSRYATYFDIEWHPVKRELEHKVLLPILEDQYGTVLEAGKLQLVYEAGQFDIRYYELRLPIAPHTYSQILERCLEPLAQQLGDTHADVQELQSILTAVHHLPVLDEPLPDAIVERTRETAIIRRRFQALHEASTHVREALDATLVLFNGRPDDRDSYDLLDALIAVQAYRPAFWRVAAEEINYRRFFDVNELAAIRVERPEVFQATHQLIFRLLAEGSVTGLRIDHIDGLADPAGYLRQLQEQYALDFVTRTLPGGTGEELATIAGHIRRRLDEGAQAGAWPLYVIAEKILASHESLPDDWAVAGCTGYEFLNTVNGLFVDGRHAAKLDTIYHAFSGRSIRYDDLLNATRKMTMLVAMVSEIYALSHQLERIAEQNRRYRDFTLDTLTFVLREVIASLTVYRTYITGPDRITPRDEQYIQAAVAAAQRRNPRTDASYFAFVRDTLLLRNLQQFRPEDQPLLLSWVTKFQQLTGPVMAKGVEDTAFYVYNRLLALNEVGGHPEQFGTPVEEFHRKNLERREHWPHGLLATSTHDTKRSEDVRARIDVLSELPDVWEEALDRWRSLNADKKPLVDGVAAPDANDEYLLYQSLIGVWPHETMSRREFAQFRERIAVFMHKATKEAKVHTSWTNPHSAYDVAVRDFVYRILPDAANDPFLTDLQYVQQRVAYFGRFNALAQALLKLTAPGVPDIYQGTELWDFSLVDPDNRRPVDFTRRRDILADLKQRGEHDQLALARELMETSPDGRIKLYLIHRVLGCRRAHEQLFAHGGYRPLKAHGEQSEHVCAFARTEGDAAVVVVVPRLVAGLTGGSERPPLGTPIWGNTTLALPQSLADRKQAAYRNVFTGEILGSDEHDGEQRLRLAAIFGHFPVALFERAQ